jgi:AraC-like DNA-binding protein
MKSHELAPGLTHIACRLELQAFSRHAHDSYTVVVTTSGEQRFSYRGTTHSSAPGQAVILHPSEVHDGMPGDGGSFSYSGLHLAAGLVAESLGLDGTGRRPLPFVAAPVSDLGAVRRLLCAMDPGRPLEPLAAHELVAAVAAAIQAAAGSPEGTPTGPGRPDRRLAMAAEFLGANATRTVSLLDLEAVTGLSMFEMSRRFRRCYGTSPYRFLLARRIELARYAILGGESLAQAAAGTGFADQAHMSRAFRAFVGITPGNYRRLAAQAPQCVDIVSTLCRHIECVALARAIAGWCFAPFFRALSADW